MSSCRNWIQLLANSSMSVSHTDLLAVRKSFCKFGSWRASLAKHPVLLCRVGHQPRSSSSRSGHPEASSAIPFSVIFLHLHRSRVRSFLHLAAIMLAITSYSSIWKGNHTNLSHIMLRNTNYLELVKTFLIISCCLLPCKHTHILVSTNLPHLTDLPLLPNKQV